MLIISSTFTANPLNYSLQSITDKFSKQKILFIYNQVFQQLILPNSEINNNSNGLNIVLIRLSDLLNDSTNLEKSFEIINDLKTAFDEASNIMQVPTLVIFTPIKHKKENEKASFDNIETKIISTLRKHKNINCISSQEICENFEYKLIFDDFSEKHGHIPYTVDFYNHLAINISRRFSLISRKPSKVIVLDCDNTLWDGVIEEDGINGIKIDEHYINFYKFIINCFKSGFLICLCSKNSEESVLSIFNNHPKMLLSLEKHICTHRINWDPKSTNIKSMAKELDLGLDSFIFIDDNRVECAEVKASIPEILAIEIPKKKTERLLFMKNIWAFDCHNKGVEDQNRTKFYQQNKLREQSKSQQASYVDFLKSLKIKTKITYAELNNYERVVQLSQRTNQFNIFPNSITSIEIDKSIKNKQPHCMVVHVSDKFGDYGLVGILIYDLTKDNLIIKNFCLSCRILGRGIEYEILKFLIKVAKKYKLEKIKIPFSITSRNIPAITFLKKITRITNLEELNEIHLDINEINLKEILNYNSAIAIKNKVSKPNNYQSNDYMLEIAANCVSSLENKKQQKIKPKSTKDNVIELFERNNIVNIKQNISLKYLGLDSLKSVLIASEIYRNYGLEINPFDLLDESFTLNKLCKKISANKTFKDIKPEKDIIYKNVPLTKAQRRLWFDEKISGSSSKNNMFVAFSLPDKIQIDILEKVIRKLISRHDILRTSVYEINNKPFIKLANTNNIDFKVKYIKYPNDVQASKFINEFKFCRFELTKAPLIKVGIITYENKADTILIAIHHIIHDGWSLSIMLDEISLLYAAYSKNLSSQVLDMAPSFLKYALWHKKNISKEVLSKQKKFWKKYLHKLPKIELIYDYTEEDSILAVKNNRINFKIDKNTTFKIKEICKKHHITIYDLLSSAFGTLLFHYTKQNDISFLTALSGRHHAFTNKTIGLFVNLVLLRFYIDPTKSFVSNIKYNKENTSKVLKNQDLPFNEILQILGDNSTTKMHAFTQAGFIFQNYPTPDLIINGKVCERILADDYAKILYDSCQECRLGNIVCFMQEQHTNLYGLFEYNTSLYNESTIKHIISSFKTLLKNISQKPSSLIKNIEINSEQQKKILLKRWNQPKHKYKSTKGLIELFLEQVEKHPNKIAIKHNDEKIGYFDLDKKSNQIAQEIMSLNLKPETPIGIFVDKKIDFIISIIATLKANCCYVPLEKEQPLNRILHICNDVDLKYLISDNNEIQQINFIYKKQIKVLNTSKQHYQNNTSVFSECKKPTPNKLAYIMYTSGSTGKPKGIMIEEQGIIRLVKNTNYINLTNNDIIAQSSSISFDAATFEIWGALLNGLTLSIIDKKLLLKPDSLKSFLKHEKISILFLTTQLFHSLAHSNPNIFKCLKYLVVGGEALLTNHVKDIFSNNEQPKYIINGYGPTENTTFSTTYTIKSIKNIHNPLPIGKPISGTEAYILDDYKNPVPIGAPGKLYLGGLGLSRGYIKHKHLNSKNYTKYLGEKVYNTGDLVCWQADGNIKYIGRDDNQVKVNGYRIELAEIEAHIEHNPEVEQAIIIVKNYHQQKQLIAYVQLKTNQDLSEVNLYHYLKQSLPRYMIPTIFYQVDNIPTTLNGKVDKEALSSITKSPVTYIEYEPPETSLHMELVNLYHHILKVDIDSIGINSEFFDLGGNSISALSLLHIIHEKYGIKIDFSELYDSSTVKLLSEKITCTTLVTVNNETLKKIKGCENNKPPIIFIHPIGGTGFCYLDLIKLLPNEQPCYIIQDPSIQADQIIFNDIKSMAMHYIEILLDNFQEQEFILAGYSFGGMLSIEMANQLKNKNLDNKLKYIISFDTWVVSNFMNKQAKSALKQSILKQYKKIEANLNQENIDPKPWMELYYIRLQELGFTYKPPKINKKIILFKAQQQEGEFKAMHDDQNYLNLHTNKHVEVYITPGNHDSILQLPNVKYINDVITNLIK